MRQRQCSALAICRPQISLPVRSKNASISTTLPPHVGDGDALAVVVPEAVDNCLASCGLFATTMSEPAVTCRALSHFCCLRHVQNGVFFLAQPSRIRCRLGGLHSSLERSSSSCAGGRVACLDCRSASCRRLRSASCRRKPSNIFNSLNSRFNCRLLGSLATVAATQEPASGPLRVRSLGLWSRVRRW
jgi:hypothetical protein